MLLFIMILTSTLYFTYIVASLILQIKRLVVIFVYTVDNETSLFSNSEDELSNNELNEILNAMQESSNYYPDIGYCFERAVHTRTLLNKGEVLTFSVDGICKTKSQVFENLVHCALEFVIPCDSLYSDINSWVYHSVYVYKNYVFTYELNDFYTLLRTYRKRLNKINNIKIKAIPEKQLNKNWEL